MHLRPCFLLLLSVALPLSLVRPQDTGPGIRARALGVEVGIMPTGPLNAITDVPGVTVGHKTLIEGDSVRTGVTVIIPHAGSMYRDKVPAAVDVFNAYGKFAGSLQIEELGTIETPIVLTNTLSVGTCVEALVRYTVAAEQDPAVRSVNAVVGETNDGYLNDIRGLHVRVADVLDAIRTASTHVEEGSVGAGTGTAAFGYKGGIGTSSRTTPPIDSTVYTVGVLVQSNFGRDLRILGIPFSREMRQERLERQPPKKEGGSCMIVIATDAPLSPRDLKRVARRSFAGQARTCSFMSSTSGDFAIAFSTAYRIPAIEEHHMVPRPPLVDNDAINLLFRAVEEATEEAIYNSLFMATTMTGYRGHQRERIPLGKVVEMLKKHRLYRLQEQFHEGGRAN